MTYPCPFCRSTADLATGCPGCGRGPDRDAADVVRLDAEIPVLTARLQQARDTAAAIDAQLHDAWQRRNQAAARVRASLATEQRPPAAPTPAPGSPAAGSPTPRTAEASTKLVQNALFLLGGLLLGTAAIVFTAVAWSQFGVGGRAGLLAAFTALALAVPPLALRRGLSATAETFAAVGLLLVLLDGYAAWYVNLFGLADGSALGYAGAVCATTVAVAAGYEILTGLAGPRFAGLLVAQPVLPLLVAPFQPTATGWSLTLAGVAVVDLAFIRLRRDGAGQVALALRITGYLLGAAAVLGSGVCALVALAMADRPGAAAGAGAALMLIAAVVVAAAVLARSAGAQAVAGGVAVLAVALAAGRVVAVAGGASAQVLVALVVGLLAVAVVTVSRWLPGAVRQGPWVGALVAVAGPGLASLADAVDAAVSSVLAARPVLAADLGAAAGHAGWQVTVTIVLLTGALAVLVPVRRRFDAVLGGAALAALTTPVGLGLTWWSAVGFDLAVAAVALLCAVRPAIASRLTASGRIAVAAAAPGWLASVAALLTAHAVAVGFGRPGTAAATLGTVVLLGVGTAVVARPSAPPVTVDHRRVLGGAALTVGLLALPAACWVGAAASGLATPWQSRIALAALAMLAPAVRSIGGRWADYRPYALGAVLLAAAIGWSWAVPSGESPAIYAAVSLLAIAVASVTGGGTVTSRWAVGSAVLPGLALATACAESLLTVLVAPYGWLGRVWSGHPAGVGIDPFRAGAVSGADAVALVLLAGAAGVAGYTWSGGSRRAAVRAAGAVLAVVPSMALAAAGARWPVVPAVSLAVGLTGALIVALSHRPVARPAAARPPAGAGVLAVAAALIGSGLAGALPTRAASLVALAVTGIVCVVAGAAGRTAPARTAGWLAGVAAFVGLAFTAGRMAGLGLPGTSFGVLAISAAALALGAALTGRRPAEAVAVQAAAHAGALTALLLTVGHARHAAAICTLWGVVVGMRALWPGESAARRRTLVVVAAGVELLGWWLLIAAERVALPEAYTLPAAAVALLAGRLRLRSGLSSWSAYGPALAAALLPTAASVLLGDGEPVRRLLLGLGALVVVLLGAHARLQAPVVAGGLALAVVALHELALVWDLLPRWIPLAAGGLLLVGLAMTLERRRRDVTRLRAAVARMS